MGKQSAKIDFLIEFVEYCIYLHSLWPSEFMIIPIVIVPSNPEDNPIRTSENILSKLIHDLCGFSTQSAITQVDTTQIQQMFIDENNPIALKENC